MSYKQTDHEGGKMDQVKHSERIAKKKKTRVPVVIKRKWKKLDGEDVESSNKSRQRKKPIRASRKTPKDHVEADDYVRHGHLMIRCSVKLHRIDELLGGEKLVQSVGNEEEFDVRPNWSPDIKEEEMSDASDAISIVENNISDIKTEEMSMGDVMETNQNPDEHSSANSCASDSISIVENNISDAKTDEVLIEDVNRSEGHYCNVCGEMFADKQKLRHHRRWDHKMGQIMCEKCSEIILRSQSHLHKCGPICRECAKHFDTIEKLEEHSGTHFVLKYFQCLNCDKTCRRKMYSHINRILPSFCEKCRLQQATNDSLT